MKMVKFIDSNDCSENVNVIGISKRRKRKRKHIPHSERPKELVIKRNNRERQRARTVNEAFEILRHKIPLLNFDNYKLTRVEILKYASKYIRNLFDMIVDSEINHLTQYYSAEYVEPKNKHDDYISKDTFHEENTNLNSLRSTTNTNCRMPLRNLDNLPISIEDTSRSFLLPEQDNWNNNINIQQCWQSYSTPMPQNDNAIHTFGILHGGHNVNTNRTSCMRMCEDNRNQMYNLQCDQSLETLYQSHDTLGQSHDILHQPNCRLGQSHDTPELSHDIEHSSRRFKSRLKYL